MWGRGIAEEGIIASLVGCPRSILNSNRYASAIVREACS